MENSRAKICRRCSRRSAEVVQEVGESGVAGRVSVVERPQGNGEGSLDRQLPQELYAVAKRMASAQLRLRLLEQQVVCMLEPERNRPNSRCSNQTDAVAARLGGDDDVRKRSRLRNGPGRNPLRVVRILPSMGKT